MFKRPENCKCIPSQRSKLINRRCSRCKKAWLDYSAKLGQPKSEGAFTGKPNMG